MSASVTAPRTVATAPRGVQPKAGSITAASATVQWLAPLDSGGAPVTDYQVETSVNGGRTWLLVRKPASTLRAVRLSNLRPERSYAVRVRARNSVGLSTPGRITFTTTS